MGPDAAVAEVRHAVRRVLGDRPALVACSGGADSLALAAATAFEASRRGLPAGLITIDHGVQPGSAAQARTVAAIGYELGFDPVQVVRVEVRTGGGLESSARNARYAALSAAADAAGAAVLLGHTLDDQAETVLLGLGRGSGPRSIAGMRAVDGRYLRPLLGVRRTTTVAACVALGFTPWDDPHNADSAFTRVRLRREVLPLLEDVLQGGVAGALARTAELIRDDLDALDAVAECTLADVGDEHVLPVAELVNLAPAIRSRVLRLWTAKCGAGPLTATHLAALDAMVGGWHGQGPIDLPGGCVVTRTSGRLTMRRVVPAATPAEE
ncbi:MAG: tRNA lysidine(34) synthetase TilS [Actinomycetota bacterium]